VPAPRRRGGSYWIGIAPSQALAEPGSIGQTTDREAHRAVRGYLLATVDALSDPIVVKEPPGLF